VRVWWERGEGVEGTQTGAGGLRGERECSRGIVRVDVRGRAVQVRGVRRSEERASVRSSRDEGALTKGYSGAIL